MKGYLVEVTAATLHPQHDFDNSLGCPLCAPEWEGEVSLAVGDEDAHVSGCD